jgi:hypothetical protein
MPDRDPADEESPRDGPGRSNLEEISEQRQSESRRQDMEAAALARAHYEVEPGLRAIYRLEGPDPNDLRIKLLEVNEQTVPTGIVPVGFAPHPASGLHYPSVVIEGSLLGTEKIVRQGPARGVAENPAAQTPRKSGDFGPGRPRLEAWRKTLVSCHACPWPRDINPHQHAGSETASRISVQFFPFRGVTPVT